MEKIKKVFSPGKDKDDEIMYGTASKEGTSVTDSTQAPQSSTLQTNPDAEQKDKGVLRQIFNPGGDKFSEQSYGTTATAAPTMSDQLEKEPASREPLKGPETAQYNNDRVQQEPLDSTYASGTSFSPSTFTREDKQDDVSDATYTARSYALGSGSSSNPQQTASNVDSATRETTDLAPTGDQSGEHAGRRLDHSLAGAGIGGAGAGYVGADELNEFMKHGRDQEADGATYTSREQYLGSSAAADPFSRPGHELYSADKGPSGVESAGEMAPGHIPGEFPADDGGDPHSKSSGAGYGTAAGVGTGAGAGAAGIAAARAYNNDNPTTGTSGRSTKTAPADDTPSSPIQTTTNTMRSGSFSRPNQDSATDIKPGEKEKENSGGFKGALAAATAAMGLGGAGAYAASRDDKDANKDATSRAAEPSTTSQSSRAPESSSVAPGSVVSDKTQSYTHRRPGDRATSETTSQPTRSREGQQPEQDNHTARNAALGAGAVGATGAGAYALSRDNDKNQPRSAVSDQTQSYAGSRPTEYSSTSRPTESGASGTQSQSQEWEKEDHTARNAALGAGGLGAAGAGAYALGRDSNDAPSNTGSGNAGSVVSEKTQGYARHHPSDTDPNLRSSTGSSATTGQSQPTAQSSEPREQDHTARNAALGAGAVGATGAGAYALSQNDRNDGNAQSVVSPETQKYTGTHPSDMNTSSYQSSGATAPSATRTQQQPEEEDHTARNAALGAGAVGAAGAGAYALSNRWKDAGNAQSVVSPETQRYTGSHPSDTNASYQGTTSGSTYPSQTQTQPASYTQRPGEQGQDHRARNAALGAGTVGATGAGAYAYGNRDGRDSGNAQSVVSPETQGYTGAHPSDTSSAYQGAPTTSTYQPSQTQTQPGSYSQRHAEEEKDHTARNAVLGAGAVGAAGAGAYAYNQRDTQDPRDIQSQVPPEAEKYTSRKPKEYKEPRESKPKETKPKESKLKETTTTATKQAEPSRRDEPIYQQQRPGEEKEDHTARNAALGAGGVGAAGAGAYYMTRDPKEVSDNLNDPNVAARQVQQYPTSQQRTSGTAPSSGSYGHPGADDAAVESSFLGAGSTSGGGASSYPSPSTETQQPSQDQGHNYGRDAAVVGGVGAAGAAGYGAYEYANRDKPANYANEPYSSPQQQSQYASPPEQYTIPQQQQYTSAQQQPYSTSQQPQYTESSAPTTSEHDPRVATTSDGHHKLHKKGAEQHPDENTGVRSYAMGPGTSGTSAHRHDEGDGRNYAMGPGTSGAAGHQHRDDDSHGSGEKKHGLMHKILHPREHKREKEEEEKRRSEDNRRSYEESRVPAPNAGDTAGTTVTEPHTGLPMDVGKYGTGAGGTDGSNVIEGYHGQGGAPATGERRY